jgi:shikimate kinase
MLNPATRDLLNQRAVTVWLRADLEVIAERVSRRDTRPLLRGKDVLATLTALAEARYPIYAHADVIADVGAGAHGQAVDAVIAALERYRQDHPEAAW